MRVRSATGQKARVRAKCVRTKVVRCEVRACGQESVTPNTLLLEHMHKKFEINQTKIKDGCQSEKTW